MRINKTMISVLTPTCRDNSLDLIEKSLKRQTFRDFEWVVVKPEGEKPKDLYWTLYRDQNRGLKQCKGELIVSLQDFTYLDPTALEKFWNHYIQEPKTLVSAVGNKYTDDSFTVMTWKDPRETDKYGSYYQCNFQDIEWNACAVPKEAIYKVGGWDESLDAYSSLAGLDILYRLNVIGGYDFKLDQTIKSYSLEHGRLPNWEENTPFKGVWQEKQAQYNANPILNYL